MPDSQPDTWRPVFGIFMTNDWSKFVIYPTVNGIRAMSMFLSREKAQHFVEATGHASEWMVVEVPRTKEVRWLQEVHDRNGVSQVMIDPDPQRLNAVRVLSLPWLLSTLPD